MNNETGGTSNGCIDPSKLAMAIFGAIFGTLLLCTGFALTIWYLVRNHQIADKLFILEVRKRRSKSEEQGEEPTNLDEVDNDFHVEKDKDLAHLSVAMEMEEIPLEKSVDKAELENKEEKEVNYERKEELDEEEEDKMVEKRELSTNKISPNLITDERVIIKEPEPIKSTRHGIILDPVAIEQPSKMDVKRPFTQNISTLAGHQRALSQESAAEASPEMIERLRMLSAEQFGMLETNRRRLEHERRQLRELGVI